MSALVHSRPHPYDSLSVHRASGALLYDVNGREILDLTSGFGVAALGYSHPGLLRAITKQLERVSHAIPSLVGFENESAGSDEIIAAIELDDGGVILTTSGAEAVEVALKAAFLATGRNGVIMMSGGYHGQSIGTLAVNAHRSLGTPLGALVGERAAVLPYPESVALDATESTENEHPLRLLEQWLFSEEYGSRQFGAFLIEPMQNLAGYRTFDRTFAAKASELCRRAGVVVIADEIFTGFGRCGSWTISESVGLLPDIICVGKAMTGGIPGGACVAKKSLLRSLFPSQGLPLHAPTFYNSPIVNAAIAASIHIIRDDSLLDRAAIIGKAIQSRLASCAGKVPGFCGVRGMGAAQALVFRDVEGLGSASDFVGRVTELLLGRGVLALNSGLPGGDVVSVCPPLVITDEHLNRGLSVIEDVLNSLSTECE